MKHNYVSAERFILSREFFGMKLGLENIGQFLRDIGTPQDRFKSIHIGGTNGKGSTATMLASVFEAAGYKTGLFTSPHLVTLRERIRVNGEMISKRSVTAFIERHRRELTRRKISYFELVTAMAFDYFARQNVEIAVIEVGLGGRLDATNVLNPLLTITTDVDFDHTEILGNTITKIAWEKAGIVKPGVPHLTGLLRPEAKRTIHAVCKERKAPYFALSRRDYRPRDDRFDFEALGLKLKGIHPGLIGPHQIQNGALVVKALAILRRNGIKIPVHAVKDGFNRAFMGGRFQLLNYRRWPLHILDVGHNAGGIAALVRAFRNRFGARKAHVLTGFVRLKAHQQMIDSLKEIALSFSLVPLQTSRSIDMRELIKTIDFGPIPYKRYGSLWTAHRHLLKSCDPDDIILVVGSHYLVGEFLGKIRT
ncbi:MAG TPA: folylpolyglutamate synthase/dihydrofolate synthase family protein [candidate division Zixibacteria bacterium]|nr:folylpolyglutamate synthase/dihydrofolate synthase family protein [candidate division Zixibacteria bacterium]